MPNDAKQEKYLQLHRIKKNVLFILLGILIEITMTVRSVLISLGSQPKGFEAGLILLQVACSWSPAPASPITVAGFAHLEVYFPEAVHMSPPCGVAVLVPDSNHTCVG